MQENRQLLPVSYYDFEDGIQLNCFADTVVYHESNSSKTLVSIRFGGYPEQVRGMTDAIYGGGFLQTEIDNRETGFSTVQKQYQKFLSHDGIYAESMMVLNDDQAIDTTDNDSDEKQENCKKAELKRQFIFCERDNKQALFDEIEKKWQHL